MAVPSTSPATRPKMAGSGPPATEPVNAAATPAKTPSTQPVIAKENSPATRPATVAIVPATAPTSQPLAIKPDPPQAKPEDLVNNAAVQKSLANERVAIQAADTEYDAKVKLLAAARQKKLDQARLTCIEELHRAQAISSQHKKTDEALAIAVKVDELTSELSDNKPAKGNSGWIVLFRSSDPWLWNTNINKGPDSFAIALTSAPQGIRYLKLARPTGDCIIFPMDNACLGSRPKTDPLWRDPKNTFPAFTQLPPDLAVA